MFKKKKTVPEKQQELKSYKEYLLPENKVGFEKVGFALEEYLISKLKKGDICTKDLIEIIKLYIQMVTVGL